MNLRWLFLFLGICLVMAGVWLKKVQTAEGEIAIDPAAEVSAPNALEVKAPKTKAPLADAGLLQLRSLFEEAKSSFPTIAEVRAHKRDPHEAPDQLFDAGATIGKIEELLATSPKNTPEGINFYKCCAKNEELLSEVRSLCIGYYAKWSESLHRRVSLDTEFPKDLVKLSQVLVVN